MKIYESRKRKKKTQLTSLKLKIQLLRMIQIGQAVHRQQHTLRSHVPRALTGSDGGRRPPHVLRFQLALRIVISNDRLRGNEFPHRVSVLHRARRRGQRRRESRRRYTRACSCNRDPGCFRRLRLLFNVPRRCRCCRHRCRRRHFRRRPCRNHARSRRRCNRRSCRRYFRRVGTTVDVERRCLRRVVRNFAGRRPRWEGPLGG